MTGPPDTPPGRTDPGGFQARADGHAVEVRTYEGDLVRIVDRSAIQPLIDGKLADDLTHCVRLKLGIRWLPPRLDRASGRPDLSQMQRREPKRYAAIWSGAEDPHVGKGALGRSRIDRVVHFG